MATTLPEMMQFEIVKHITLPFFIIPNDTPVYIKFSTAIAKDTSSFSERVTRRRKAADDTTTAPKKDEAMDIANIVNLQTGEEMRLVAHQVLSSTLNEAYPENGYVNKLFKIVKSEKKGGRGGKYFAFDIAEIRLKQTATEQT